MDLGQTYGVQYGFQVLEGLASDTLVFSIVLPNSNDPVFTQEVEIKSTRDFLTFMELHMLALPYHQVLSQILDWNSNFTIENYTSNSLTSVDIKNPKTDTVVNLSCADMLCNFQVTSYFTGKNKQMFVETSQGYRLSFAGLGESDTLSVFKSEHEVPLPCVARKVIDLLGELPVYGEKTSQGELWTYK